MSPPNVMDGAAVLLRQRSALLVAAASTLALAVLQGVRRRRRHALAEQESVLRFWFEGDAAELYSSRWFVQHGSSAQVRLDEEVRVRFSALLRRAEHGELQHWAATARGSLALIVLLDQLSRHAHRAERATVDANDQRALPVAEAMLARGWLRQLQTRELVFALMPLRHQPTEERLNKVLLHAKAVQAENSAEEGVLSKFLRHTELRLQHLQSDGDPLDILEKADLEANLEQSGAPFEPLAKTIRAFLSAEANLALRPQQRRHAREGKGWGPKPHTKKRGKGCGGGQKDAARAGGGQKDETPSEKDETPSEKDETPSEKDETPSEKDETPSESLLVSLSGGVDSMVLLHILLCLRKSPSDYAVAAVHIDYANRVESGAEADFLRSWCEARGVPLHVRVVSEVSRGVTARDQYEKESRRIRFEAYRDAMAHFGAKAVFFGHHMGDVQENVISNVMKGCALLNVSGIAQVSQVTGVTIWRPMLPHPKDEIYDYAHKYGVPYFKDSTPVWSTRGRLRNKLVPLLSDLYGEGFASHLNTLSRDSSLCCELLESHLFNPFRASLRTSPIAVSFDASAWAALPLFFWREALREVCEKFLGIGLVKEKAVEQLLERLRLPSNAKKQKDGWLALKKESRCLLSEGWLAFFRPGAFPGHHVGRVWVSTPHVPAGTALLAPREGEPLASYQLGAWRIQIHKGAAPASADGGCGRIGPPSAASAPAGDSLSIWKILSGRFAYQLPARSAYRIAEVVERPGGLAKAEVHALQQVASQWQGLLHAIPQVVEAGEPREGTLTVQYEFVSDHQTAQ